MPRFGSPREVVTAGCLVLLTLVPAASFAQDVPFWRNATPTFLAEPPSPQKDGKAKKKEPIFTYKEHPTWQFGPVRISARARFAAKLDHSDAPITDVAEQGLDVARRRIGMDGRVANAVDFQVEYEINNDDPWRDVYLNVRQLDYAQFQFGKFKQPFSLDETTSATNLDFVYRSLAASTLSPGRDKGWMFHGRALRRIFRYEYGVFQHDGSNSIPKHSERVYGGQTKTWRVAVSPLEGWKSPFGDLLVGYAFSTTDIPEGFSSIRGKTVLGADFYKPDYFVLGTRERRGFELRWRPGPASFKAEWIRVTEERQGEGVEDNDASPLRATGWYVSGTFALTGGGKKADGFDMPKHPFLQGGVGVIEVAARVERLRFDTPAATTGELPSSSPRADVVIGNSDKVVTFGANWYLNKWIKIQYNIVREQLDDPTLGPLPSQPVFWSRLLRFQFSL
jgi:phosphate-selective porin